MDKRFWIIIGVIVAVFAGILWFGGGDKDDSGSNSSAKPTSHLLGNKDAKVKIVEYGDYQCPYCGLFHPVTKQVIEKYGDKISFQFRHFPLNQIHENAVAAARAAEAADKQDKFWEMHNMLFENQEAWSQSSKANTAFEAYAKQLDLDIAQYKKDFADSKTLARINADKAEFNKTKQAASTPTFFLNGKKIQPEASLESFSKLIDEALEKQGN
jgi:protein-disulfide isomerase